MDTLLLEQLISINSVFPNESALAKFIDQWIEKNIPNIKKKTQLVANKRINLTYSKGTGKKSVVLIGHLDTIPIVTGWETDPLKPKLKGKMLFGLGAWDMKAGLYIILQCLKKFNPENITLKVAFTVDEENFSEGAHALVKSDFFNNSELLLVPEPGFIHGHNGITIGRTGRSTYSISLKGKSAHGSKPQEGVNAILEAQILIKEIMKLTFSKNKYFGKTMVYPSAIKSSVKGFSVPDECELEIDCKLVSPDTPKLIFDRLTQLMKKLYSTKKLINLPTVSYKKRPTPFCEPYTLNKKDQYVELCEKALKQITKKAIIFYRYSVADECIYVSKTKIPALTIGPWGKNAHQSNEGVDLKSVEIVEKIYLNILSTIDNKFKAVV